jgi:Icc-related predicted phosphoesterase
MSTPTEDGLGRKLRIAAAGDLHCREGSEREVAASIERVAVDADLLLLCGDLTTHGRPAQALPLARACSDLDIPVLAVLGNHDWHCNDTERLMATLQEGGITMLERDSRVLEVGGIDVGIVGLKGFIGGFAGSHLPDFGEPLLRQVYAVSTEDARALDAGLRAVALCPVRIVMLHYAPTTSTIQGEAPGIWAFLGTDRLAAPIAEHEPDLVLHGHAHAGTFQGAIGDVPVYNVSQPLMGRDFWVFEMDRAARSGPAIH